MAGNLSAYSNTATATTTGTTGGTIKFIQGNYAVPSSATTVTVTFTAAQTAGNLNVVVVGWNDTTHTVSSVTDSSSNTYVEPLARRSGAASVRPSTMPRALPVRRRTPIPLL